MPNNHVRFHLNINAVHETAYALIRSLFFPFKFPFKVLKEIRKSGPISV
jgi:hypothetical protein